MQRNIFLTALAGLALVAAAPTKSKAPATVTVRWAAPVSIAPGKTVPANLLVTVAPGYHIQGNPTSEEFMIATELKLDGKQGVALTNVGYPRGKKFTLPGGDKPILALDGELALRCTLQAASGAKPGTATLKGELSFQACDNKICLPPDSVPVTLEVRVKR